MANGRQQTLNTMVVISGKVDNSFTRLGHSLMELGATIDIVGGKVREFTQDSVSMYADYDDTLRAIQGKLGDATAAQMDALNEQMRDWAEVTRYSATEVSGAVDEAAAAGWMLEEIYGGIPEVMDLAAAANLDLVQSMEYLNSGIAGMGLELADADELIDQWVKTANVGRTSVEDLGESMETLGSLMTFTDSSEELFTLLTIMGEYGTKGAEAGTLLRNVILRLVAPTDKATAALQMLGATEEELAELEAADLGNAAERMDELGLSAFDAKGELKSVVDIVDELRTAVSGMTEQEMYDTLYDIFPTRTIRGIMDLLRSTPEEYEAVMQQIVNSDGYAEWVAQLQEGGIGGALRTLDSQLEEFKLTYGEALSDDVAYWAGVAGDALGWLSDLPEDTIDAATKMLGTLAVAGPVLIGVGSAVSVIGMLANPVTATAVAITAAVGGIAWLADVYKEAKFEDIAENFGEMTLDAEDLNDHLYDLNSGFRNSYAPLNEYADAVDNAVESYKTASTQLSSDLLTASITGKTLTDADKQNINSLVDEMYQQTVTAIENSTAGSMSYWEMIFGGEGVATSDEDYIDLIGILGNGYDEAMAQAEQISKDLRGAISSAWEDGEISAEEYQQLLTYFEQYNALIAKAEKEARDKEERIQRKMLLAEAQTASLEDLQGYAADMAAQRDAAVAAAKEEAAYEYFSAEDDAEQDFAAGRITEDEKNDVLKDAKAAQEAHINGVYASYDDDLIRLWESGLAGTELWEPYQNFLGFSELYGAGAVSSSEAYDRFRGEYGGDTIHDLEAYLGMVIDSLGGIKGVYDRIDEYTAAGNVEAAQKLQVLWDASQIAGGYAPAYTIKMPEGRDEGEDFAREYQRALDANPGEYKVKILTLGSAEATHNTTIAARFADGGRATEASIFGEAGAEWAIPEAHTPRTASLLNAARAASGFSWSELISESGGGSGGGNTYSLVYSPTIISNDASGVEAALKADKARLDEWYAEKTRRDEMEVFR